MMLVSGWVILSLLPEVWAFEQFVYFVVLKLGATRKAATLFPICTITGYRFIVAFYTFFKTTSLNTALVCLLYFGIQVAGSQDEYVATDVRVWF